MSPKHPHPPDPLVATPIIDDLATTPTAEGLCLLVVGGGFVCTYPLPATGDVVIGRSPDADLHLDMSSLSRRHAVLHMGDSVQIEDLNSANGTSVHGARIAPERPVSLAIGDSVELGNVTVLLQRSSAAVRPRRIWTHGYFEARLEEECARARRSTTSFTLLRIRVVSRGSLGDELPDNLVSLVREEDIIASYGPDDYEVLMLGVGTDAERDPILQRIHLGLRAHGAQIRIGVAVSPADAQTPEALMAKACAAVLDRKQAAQSDPDSIVVQSPVMKRLHQLVGRVAAGTINVLLLGETGVGKEVFASRVHELSPRVNGPYVRLNCAEFTESLIESELFGHEKGAFTGAQRDKPGLFEVANGGSVFLDEIGDLPLHLQSKLLRVLEERRVRRVGGLEDRPVDIRIVAATHKNLEEAVERETFRRDLYFRLNGVAIVIPPLRERRDEIAPLAHSFLHRTCAEQNLGAAPEISPAAMAQLESYSWPGNIRELRNVMERAALLCMGRAIELEHLPSDKLTSATTAPREGGVPAQVQFAPPALSVPPAQSIPPPPDSPEPLENMNIRDELAARERELIIAALERTGGNQTQAAKVLGMPRRTLADRIESYGLPRPRKKND